MHWRRASLMYLAVGATGGVRMLLGMSRAMAAGFNLYRAGAITIGTAYLLIHNACLLERPIVS